MGNFGAFAHFFQRHLLKTACISAGSDRSNSSQNISNMWIELLYQMTERHYHTNDFEKFLLVGDFFKKTEEVIVSARPLSKVKINKNVLVTI